MQYVPIHKLLKCILDSKNFMSTVLQYQCSNDGLLRDFHDGQFCKEHNSQNLKLPLYVDKCEFANSLGSKAGLHKIGVVYCTVSGLTPKISFTVVQLFLVAMFNEEDVKMYGYDIIMRPLVDDIKELETNGVHIDSDVFNGTVRMSIAQVSGDNLGANGICGFVERFVGNYHCRHCKMHRNDMWYSSTETRMSSNTRGL